MSFSPPSGKSLHGYLHACMLGRRRITSAAMTTGLFSEVYWLLSFWHESFHSFFAAAFFFESLNPAQLRSGRGDWNNKFTLNIDKMCKDYRRCLLSKQHRFYWRAGQMGHGITEWLILHNVATLVGDTAQCGNCCGWYCRMWQHLWVILQDVATLVGDTARCGNSCGWYCRMWQLLWVIL